MALYRYHPPSITSPLRGKVKVQVVKDHMEHQQEVLGIKVILRWGLNQYYTYFYNYLINQIQSTKQQCTIHIRF